jgi:ubiquinone biosynthesis protein COQ9
MDKIDNLINLRDQLLVAVLNHVPFDGWSSKAIEAGAENSRMELDWGPEVAYIAFPRGVPDLVDHMADWTNRRMLDELDRLDIDSMRIRDRISTSIRLRLQILSSHREGIRRLIAYLALPQNSFQAAKLTWKVADNIWYVAGDKSSDYNYYTKRGLLASIYSTTVLYWLADESDDFVDTWSYLDRRIENVMKIPKVSSNIKKALKFLPNLLYTRLNANN